MLSATPPGGSQLVSDAPAGLPAWAGEIDLRGVPALGPTWDVCVQPGGRVAVLEFSRPRNRLIGWGYGLYFRRVLPLIGQVVSRSRENAYNYLPRSVLAFPDYDALAAKMRAAGLADVWFRPLTFGVATLYVGTKPHQTP